MLVIRRLRNGLAQKLLEKVLRQYSSECRASPKVSDGRELVMQGRDRALSGFGIELSSGQDFFSLF